MKIDKPILPPGGDPAVRGTPSTRKPEPGPGGGRLPPPPSASADETVALSSRASLLARAEQMMNEVPEIDWQRVETLRAAIQSGQFRIHPEKIADSLVREVEGLLHSES